MKRFILIIMISALGFAACAGELLSLQVRDEATTFTAVETLFSDAGAAYWGEKALAALFGAHPKSQGENLVILCKDDLCVPFYKDDPKGLVLEYQGKSYLLAEKAAEPFGYVRLESDRAAGELRLYKTEKTDGDEPSPLALPELSFTDPGASAVSLSRFKEEKTLLYIWAPWDKKSRTGLSQWTKAIRKLDDETLNLILVAQTVEGRDRLEPCLSQLNPRPTCLADAGMRLTMLFKLKSLPAVALLDEKGRLVWGPESADPGDADFMNELKKWIDGEPSRFEKEGPAIDAANLTPEMEEAARRLELAATMWKSGKKSEAMDELRRVIDQFPGLAVLNAQLEAMKNPQKVYATPSPTPAPSPTGDDEQAERDS